MDFLDVKTYDFSEFDFLTYRAQVNAMCSLARGWPYSAACKAMNKLQYAIMHGSFAFANSSIACLYSWSPKREFLADEAHQPFRRLGEWFMFFLKATRLDKQQLRLIQFPKSGLQIGHVDDQIVCICITLLLPKPN